MPPEIQVQATYHRRRRADHRAIRRHADRAADERRRQHELHALRQRQQRHDAADASTSTSRPTRTPTRSSRRCARPRRSRSCPQDVNNFGVTVQKSTSSPLMLFALYSPERHLRQHLSGQLRVHQPERPVHARARHRQRAGLRRGPVRDALLGEARPARQARPHRSGDHQRDPGAEHREPRRPDRRRAGAARAGIHLRRARAGPAANAEEFGEIVVRANPDGSLRAPERRRAHRARRADLQPAAAGSTASRPRSSRSTSCPAPTPSTRPTASRS